MKKSKFFLAFTILSAVAITAASMTMGNPGKHAFRLKVAEANVTVTCCCSFWGVNDNCLVNNNGSNCAPDGTAQCQGFNANCGGKNLPTPPPAQP